MLVTPISRPAPAVRLARQGGLTLIELMITIVVLAIVLGIAAPSFVSIMEGSRLTATANDLLADIQYARLEAIRRHQRMSLCSKDQANDQCSSHANDWGNGWIVFTDTTNNSGANPKVDNGETIIRLGNRIRSGLIIRGDGDLAYYISFTPDGRSRQTNGGFLAGTLRMCSPSSSLDDDRRARDIVINNTGRAVIVHPKSIDKSCPTP